MRRQAWLVLVLLHSAAWCQQIKPSERPVESFRVEGVSRLVALAKLGALTNTTLLVEAGSLVFLEAPVVVTVDHATAATVIREILRGLPSYKLRDEGALLILSTPGKPNRALNLPLGAFSFTGGSISSLHPLLAYSIRRATGCNPQGYIFAGPPLDVAMPPIQLAHATLEQIITKVADAAEASMWVIGPEPSLHGCIDDPASRWEVGLYGFGRGFTQCGTIFRESLGPSLVLDDAPGRDATTDCIAIKPINPVKLTDPVSIVFPPHT